MPLKLVIIGGVAGGASAAARARRMDENAEIILLERGEYISFANCGLPYYIGGEIRERDDLLVASPALLRDRFKIDVRVMSEATSINRIEKSVEIRNNATGEIYSETYDKLILSPGAYPVKPPLPGADLDTIYTLRNIPDTDRIKKRMEDAKPESAVIVGGGFIGLEMAENLIRAGVKATVVEMLEQVMPPIDYDTAAIAQEHLRAKGVELLLGKAVNGFSEEGGRTAVSLKSGEKLLCDMVILSIGVRPETALAIKAGLELGPRGGIKTDGSMRTSDPFIFATGDAVETPDFITGLLALIPLAGPANRQGRIAADNALGHVREYRGTQGTAIVRLFDLAIAATGASEKTLKRENIPHLASWTHSVSNASYFPGAQMLSIKLLFSPGDGKLLGAQATGGKGTDKRIDVLATAIRAGMTVFGLEDLELAYAPPYGSAKDAVNIAGFAAANAVRGDVAIASWDAAADFPPDKYQFLDLRNKPEIDSTSLINSALNIPLHQLRGRLNELDRGKTIVAYCAVGLRGYIGARILSQNGFSAMNLSGGYRTWSAAAREKSKLIASKT